MVKAMESEAASCSNALISAGVGGRPVRSKVARRMRVLRLVLGLGDSPFCSRLAARNWSMG